MSRNSGTQTGLALGMVWLAFGSTYIGIALSTQTMPPLLSTGFRFAAAATLIFLGILLAGKIANFVVPVKQIATAGVAGAVVMGLNIGAIALAAGTVPTSLMAISEALIPIWVIIFRLSAKERFGRQVAAGVLIGFVGVLIAVLGAKTAEDQGLAIDAIMWLVIIQASSVLWAYFAWKAPTVGLPVDSLVSTVYQMIGAAVALTVAGTLVGEQWNVVNISSVSFYAMIYLIVISALGYIAYTWMITNSSASLASSFTYTSPVIASVLGFLFAGEIITELTLVGLVATVIGVVLITKGETKPALRSSVGLRE